MRFSFVLFILLACIGTIHAQPKDFAYYKSLGLVQYYEKNFLEAIFNLQKANGLKAHDKEVMSMLKMSYDSIGSKDLSGKMRMKIEQFGDKAIEKHPILQPAGIVDDISRAETPKPKNSQVTIQRPKQTTAKDVGDIRQLGDFFLERQSYDSAIICYHQYLRLLPTDTGVYYYIAVAQYSLKQYDAAIDNFSIALKQDPERADIYNWMGVSQFLKGGYLAARDYFKQCLRYDKEYSLAYFNLAKTQYELEDYGSAAKNLEKAHEFLPNDLDVTRLLADIYYNAGKWDTAEHLYEKLYQNNKRSEKYNARLGDICSKLGKWDKAILFLENYLDIVTISVDAQKKLGIAYYHVEKYTFAIDHFEQAIKTLWDDKELMLYTAIAANKLGNSDKAAEYAQRAISLDKNFARAYYQLAIAYRTMGRKKEAKVYFKKANELGVNEMNP